MTETTATFDVIAVELGSKRVTVIGQNRDWQDAQGLIAIGGTGLGRHNRFYTTAEAGRYRDGDTYGGAK